MIFFLSNFRAWIFFLGVKNNPGDATIFFSGPHSSRNSIISLQRLSKFFWYFVLGIKSLRFTLGCTCKFIPPPWYKGGLMEPLPRVFDMLQDFKMILPLVESLWSSQQDEVYFMGVGIAGGLWRHQQWSPSWPTSSPGRFSKAREKRPGDEVVSWPLSWILPRIYRKKIAINGNYLCLCM